MINRNKLIEKIEITIKEYEDEPRPEMQFYKNGVAVGFISGAFLSDTITSEEYSLYSYRISTVLYRHMKEREAKQ